MKLVTSWSHYLEFHCNDCGKTTYVDAALNFPTTVACCSIKCRTSPKRLGAVANGNRSVQIGIPAGYPGCQEP